MTTMTPPRKIILAAVNRHRQRWGAKRLGRRHLQLAVNIARQNALVPGSTLEAAGFHAVRR